MEESKTESKKLAGIYKGLTKLVHERIENVYLPYIKNKGMLRVSVLCYTFFHLALQFIDNNCNLKFNEGVRSYTASVDLHLLNLQ
jgi:hypothetical protein